MKDRALALVVGLAVLVGLAASAGAEVDLQSALERAHRDYRGLDEGRNAQYIPALAEADSKRFGLAAVTVDGDVFTAGDADVPFAIMSAAKPFTLALVLEQHGRAFVRERIGVEPTGEPFNALEDDFATGRAPLNPMVNAGAIATVSLVEAKDSDARWSLILDRYGVFAGEPLEIMNRVYDSVGGSNFRNRALVNLLEEKGRLGADPLSSLEVYNRQSSVGVTARQLATMGATLANGGLNPRTGKRAMAPALVDEVLAVMLMAGFYDESGRWAYDVGLPAKSGVGGGIVAVVPGRMALAAYSPKLSPAGNSVRGMRALASIAEDLGLSLFTSRPKGRATGSGKAAVQPDKSDNHEPW